MGNCCSKECEICKKKKKCCATKCQWCNIDSNYIKNAFNIDEFSYDIPPEIEYEKLNNKRQYSV